MQLSRTESGAHTLEATVVGARVKGAAVVVAAATQAHARQPRLSVVHVGTSVERKHWHAAAVGQDAEGAVVTATVVARMVVVLAAAPHEHALGQPLLSVDQVMATPAAQPQAGRGPQRAVVRTVVATVVTGAAVVVFAVVPTGFAVVVAGTVVAATVVAAEPEGAEQ